MVIKAHFKHRTLHVRNWDEMDLIVISFMEAVSHKIIDDYRDPVG